MKASSVILLAAAFVSIALSTTNAIRCYVCTSATSSNCGTDSSGIQDCGSSVGSCAKDAVGSLETRSCGTSGSTGCKGIGSLISCTCNTDLCNTATVSTTPSRVLYVMIPLALISKLISSAIM